MRRVGKSKGQDNEANKKPKALKPGLKMREGRERREVIEYLHIYQKKAVKPLFVGRDFALSWGMLLRRMMGDGEV
jgi:hypothetical protein